MRIVASICCQHGGRALTGLTSADRPPKMDRESDAQKRDWTRVNRRAPAPTEARTPAVSARTGVARRLVRVHLEDRGRRAPPLCGTTMMSQGKAQAARAQFSPAGRLFGP